MRKVLERVNERLQGFVSQRDDLAMVVHAVRGRRASSMLKILEESRRPAPSEMYWVFAEAVPQPRRLRDHPGGHLRRQERCCEDLAGKGRHADLAELPRGPQERQVPARAAPSGI